MQDQVIPRPEYPRPQFVRENWLNLNGTWQFEMDFGNTGRERGLVEKHTLDQTILIPFCPESNLSGIIYKDFMPAVWYKREFEIPESWNNQTILLHFGAVDYEAEVWVNGISVGTHKGGYTPFSLDITAVIQSGSNTIIVCAEDDLRSGLQPSGKQSDEYAPHHCHYHRTTGIWQTVWLEAVPKTYIQSIRSTPDLQNKQVHFEVALAGVPQPGTIHIELFYHEKKMGEQTLTLHYPVTQASIPVSELYVWDVGTPNLYDCSLRVETDEAIDEVQSYVGIRSIRIQDHALLLNDKPVFQRLVLDQGFYPEGIYTAPSDEDLKRDIELSMELGFNGARLHEKIFEPRFLYWADQLGYLVWGEHANWGLDITNATGLERFLPEWLEALERDYNHPSIVGWCPFNETWDFRGKRQHDEVVRQVYRITKRIDPTRPVIDTSGNYHVETDIFDVHDYDQDAEQFAARYEPMKYSDEVYVTFPERQKYHGQPYMVSEYGGIWWNPGQMDSEGWGYGNRPTSEEEFLMRFEKLTTTLLDNPKICAFCYTQLYDVEQEVNGLLTYYRKPKFNPEMIHAILSKPAAIERTE